MGEGETIRERSERASMEATRAEPAPSGRADLSPRVPARLGQFLLLEPLGRGGMGAVYSAYDLRLDRKVAIKVLAQLPTSPSQRHASNLRLMREAQAMAKLSHPNVVPIYQAGVEGDIVFIAMEYVVGQTLEEWLLTAAPSWRAIVAVFAQAGRGLAAAHAAGIIHRDFKPANVLLDGSGNVRVTDFGIARFGPEASAAPEATPNVAEELTPPSRSHQLTADGTQIGTPAFMSPEQHRGEVADARSDQFSFCVALYGALFGQRPFGQGDEMAIRVIEGSVAKIDPRSPVPGRIQAAVLRGLALSNAARFPSMMALIEELARDPGGRPRQLGLGFVGALAIAGVASVVGWRLHAQAAEAGAACDGAAQRLAGVWDPEVRATLEARFAATGAPYAAPSIATMTAALDHYSADWVAMHTDACRATRVRGEQSEHVLDLRIDCLERRLGEVRALTGVMRGDPTARTLEKGVEAVSALTPLSGCADTAALLQPAAGPREPAARARVAVLRARLDQLVALRRFGRDADALPSARSLVVEARGAGDPALLAEALTVQGTLEVGAGALEAAAVTLDESLRRARDTGDPARFAAATVELAEAYAVGGISTGREGLGVVRIARALADQRHDPALVVRLLIASGRLNLTLAHRELALPLLQDAVARARATLAPDHPLLLRAELMLASTLSFNKRHAEALAEYEALIAAATRQVGALHPLTVMARLDHCRARVLAGDVAHLVACHDAALRDADRVVGAGARGVITARAYYAMSLADAGLADAAHAVYATAFDNIPAEAWTARWYVAADIARALGLIELGRGDFAAAQRHCARAHDATEPQHRGLVDPTCIAEAQLGLGDATGALATLAAVVGQVDAATPAERGGWRAAQARALWAARRDASAVRALAAKARLELPPDEQAALDRWLATVAGR